jgi:hypothetical protein
MARPVVHWCDDCQLRIDDVADGLVAREELFNGRVILRVVHRPEVCPRWRHKLAHGQGYENLPRRVAGRDSFPLREFLGPFGMLRVLASIAAEDYPEREGMELLKRLQVPDYLAFSNAVDEAVREGVLGPEADPLHPTLWELRTVLEWRAGLARADEEFLDVFEPPTVAKRKKPDKGGGDDE